jgi:2-oxo-4-hydroxy-4-carboxy-5-ureidoimidazoline decarboxylase
MSTAPYPRDLDALNAMPERGFTGALADIFEHAPWVAHSVISARPFTSLRALHDALTQAVRASGPEQQLLLIRNHPDLAGKAARSDGLTEDSKAEQSSAGLDRLSDDEYARFDRLNSAYRGKFDFPFIICARRHTKDSILQQMEERAQNNRADEIETALREVFRIVALRLDQRVRATDRLPVHGRLSTHVLDTYHGRPAAGVAIELVELSRSGAERRLAASLTNADGRTENPLIDERPLPIGRYELRFEIGDYFQRQAVRLPAPPFLERVPVRFAIAEAEGHYHVPLLATPWSYTTYRGS